jgi:hypothetical protein
MFHPQEAEVAVEVLANTISEVSELNINLSKPQKELLRWHYRLGHLNFRTVQFIMRLGVLAHTRQQRQLHTTVCKLKELPKCAACLYGKQTRRSAPGQVSSIVRDRQGHLNTQKPGLPENMFFFFIFNNFFFVNLNWYLVFTCTVQNNLLLVLPPSSLCIITFLIYYLIHLYLIYMCLHTELLS